MTIYVYRLNIDVSIYDTVAAIHHHNNTDLSVQPAQIPEDDTIIDDPGIIKEYNELINHVINNYHEVSLEIFTMMDITQDKIFIMEHIRHMINTPTPPSSSLVVSRRPTPTPSSSLVYPVTFSPVSYTPPTHSSSSLMVSRRPTPSSSGSHSFLSPPPHPPSVVYPVTSSHVYYTPPPTPSDESLLNFTLTYEEEEESHSTSHDDSYLQYVMEAARTAVNMIIECFTPMVSLLWDIITAPIQLIGFVFSLFMPSSSHVTSSHSRTSPNSNPFFNSGLG